jgi:hypothetical protein
LRWSSHVCQRTPSAVSIDFCAPGNGNEWSSISSSCRMPHASRPIGGPSFALFACHETGHTFCKGWAFDALSLLKALATRLLSDAHLPDTSFFTAE